MILEVLWLWPGVLMKGRFADFVSSYRYYVLQTVSCQEPKKTKLIDHDFRDSMAPARITDQGPVREFLLPWASRNH